MHTIKDICIDYDLDADVVHLAYVYKRKVQGLKFKDEFINFSCVALANKFLHIDGIDIPKDMELSCSEWKQIEAAIWFKLDFLLNFKTRYDKLYEQLDGKVSQHPHDLLMRTEYIIEDDDEAVEWVISQTGNSPFKRLKI